MAEQTPVTHSVDDAFYRGNVGWHPDAFEHVSNLGTATGLTRPPEAMKAIVTVGLEAVRWRADGVDPTSAIGILLPEDSSQIFTGRVFLDALKFITIAGSAQLHVQYFK